MPGNVNLFYLPPQPVQPAPHVPIPAQGQQPPRVGPLQLVDEFIIRWTWEPPPPMPTQKPLRIVPLTLIYGQQPPLGNQPFNINEISLIRSWQPPPPEPTQRPLKIVPLTLTYGQQPPLGNQPAQIVENEIIAMWQPPWYGTQRTGPFTPGGFDNPPFYRCILEDFLAIRHTWNPPPPEPWQLPRKIVPLTLIYGDAPPIGPLPAAVNENTAIASWPMAWYPAQSADPVAPLTIIVVSFVPSPSAANFNILIRSWQPADPLPILPRGIAPLTLTYGQEPPRYSTVGMLSLVQAWNPPAPMPYQSPRFTAGIAAPIVVIDIGGWVEATQTYVPGVVASQIYVQGAVAMQTYLQGAVAEEEKDSQP